MVQREVLLEQFAGLGEQEVHIVAHDTVIRAYVCVRANFVQVVLEGLGDVRLLQLKLTAEELRISHGDQLLHIELSIFILLYYEVMVMMVMMINILLLCLTLLLLLTTTVLRCRQRGLESLNNHTLTIGL